MTQRCDLVLEGGGVKGIALVGAISVLEEAGYEFNRIAGTSAGAIVGALVAAGFTSADLAELMRDVDYRKFQDEWWLTRIPGGKLISLLTTWGMYRGDYLHQWLSEILAERGVVTFDDLPPFVDSVDDSDDRRFRLVTMASDLTLGRLARLPWDYRPRYGLDPGRQAVADAVRASMSIPFLYRPVRLTDCDGRVSVLVDGGVLSNFPIDVFDRRGETPRWPTFGLKLSALPGSQTVRFHVRDVMSMARALIGTMISAHDQMHIDDPSVVARTIFIDTLGVDATDFDLDRQTARRLYDSGRAAAEKFLARWDWEEYTTTYRT
ncbi:MAG TPA: patatin-like phospholipase family protein [Micromonospora sp.]